MASRRHGSVTSPPRLLFEHDAESVLGWEVCGGLVVVYSCRAPDKPTSNEDAVGVLPLSDQNAVMILADGVGGSNAGAAAARIVVESFAEKLSVGDFVANNARAAILDAMEEANERVFSLGVGAASTVAVVELNRGTVRPYHAGDSLVLLCSNRGKIRHSTIAHSPTGMAVESGLIDQRDALHHQERNLISNFVGSRTMRIEIGPSLQMAKRDTVLIASDGLCDNLFLDEIVDVIRAGQLPRQTQRMIDLARDRMSRTQSGLPSKPDDLSVICFRQSL